MKITAFLAVLLAAAGCTFFGPEDDTPGGILLGAPDFGQGYVVDRAEKPLLLGDSLRAFVSFSGGCKPHDFRLGADLGGKGATLWLRHETPEGADSCEAWLSRVVTVAVPEAVSARRPLMLAVPDGEAFVLAP